MGVMSQILANLDAELRPVYMRGKQLGRSGGRQAAKHPLRPEALHSAAPIAGH